VPGRLDNVQLHLVTCLDEAMECKRWLGARHENDAVAFDTETEGLHFWEHKLRLVQFGDTVHGWVVPWEDWAGLAKEMLREFEGDWVAHNLKFDQHAIDAWGGLTVPWHRAHDTSVLAHLQQPDRPRGLKFLGDVLVDRRASSGQQALHEGMAKAGWTWATVPVNFQPYWAYAALDPVLTAHLWDVGTSNLGSKSLYDLERDVSRICFAMEKRGARIDIPYVQVKRKELDDFVVRQRAFIEAKWGVHPGKTAMCSEFFKAEGVTLTKITKGGTNYALDKEVLDEIDHPLAAEILKYRQAQKILSSYFDNLLELRDGDVVHCSINTLGARTGRMSITDPALQTLPRGGEENPFADLVRAAFIPRENQQLISCDLDQVEARLLAHFANDENFNDAIRRGDIHTESARKIFSEPDMQKSDPRRQVTKNAIFAILYGAGTAKMAATAGISTEEGALFMNEFQRTFPLIRPFMRRVEQTARDRLHEEGEAYVVSPYGRRHPADERKLYTLVNYLIQGTAADYFKDALTRLDAAGLTDKLLLPIHDEIVLEAGETEAKDVALEVERLMSDVTNWHVPITAGAKVMSRWKK
jgi:DNA polymerase I-like protein with 3'-5' exonuclease and polymerase domains